MFKENNKRKCFTRGKFVYAFFIDFCSSLSNDYDNIPISSLTKTVKTQPLLKIQTVASCCRIPATLKNFLENTICNFISDKLAA